MENVSDDIWAQYDNEVQNTSYRQMAVRLPAILWALLRECWNENRADTAMLVLFTLASELLTALGLLATPQVLTGLLTAGPTPERVLHAAPGLAVVGGALVARAVLNQAVEWIRSRLASQLRLIAGMRILELATEVDLLAYDDRKYCDSLHLIRERSPESLSTLLFSGLRVTSGVIGLAVSATVILVLNPVLLILLPLAVVPDWWASVRSGRLVYELYTGTSNDYRRMFALGELMAGRGSAAEIRSHGMRSYLLDRYRTMASTVRDLHLQSERRQATTRALGQALAGGGAAVVYIALAVMLLTGVVPLAVAGTAMIAIRTGLGALRAVGSSITMTYENALFYQDYVEFCADASGWLERGGGLAPPRNFEEIVLRDVTFTYPSARTPALRGVDVTITPGETVALVGENGAGKSTLAKIIAGLYLPRSGKVTYGGIPVHELDLALLRRKIAVVAQDFTRWPLSVRDNISSGDPACSGDDARVMRAATAAGAGELIRRLDHGFDTVLDPSYESGVDLSGGQWQRIAVARGLYRDAGILVFDEPTSALDVRVERAIFDTVRSHAHDRTVVLVTHRLAAVTFADRIIVLREGRVVACGAHHELMQESEYYRELYLLHASSYSLAT